MNVEIQDEKLQGMDVTCERLRLEMAVGLYASGDATLGQAASIACVSQTRFLHEIGRRGVCVHYGVEELQEDLRTLQALRSS